MAYKKSPLKSTRLRKHKRKVRIASGIGALIALGVILFLVWKLVRLPVVMINGVTVVVETPVGGQADPSVTSDDVKTVVTNDLSGAYWHFFPKANRLWYPQDLIRQDILNDFPPINFISFQVGADVLTVNVEERQPAYLWCPEQQSVTSNAPTSSCYFTDATGYIFSPAPSPETSSGASYLLLYGALATSTAASSTSPTVSSSESPIGQMYASPGDFQNIVTFVNDLSTLGLKVTSVVSEGSDVYDAYLEEPGRIIFKATDDPSTLESDIATLKANGTVFSQNSTVNGTASGTSTLDYVDLRFGDKVYYKFVGQ